METFSRRALIGGLTATVLARPAIIRAQTSSAPVIIGLLSDLSGPYRENGGLGSRIATEMAVADFGGSVLGRPIQVIQADDQNKADLASGIARQWIDERGVSLLADGAGSSAGLAIQQIAREKERIYVMTGPIANGLIGAQCSPYGFQFCGSAYSLTKGATTTLTRQGDDTWFTIVADYESGYTLEHDMQGFAKAAGGRIVGGVRAPLGTADYSSFLLQAQASGAKVIGLGLAGADAQNCVKQAAEFGIAQGRQRLSAPVMAPPDVYALGQDVCAGLVMTSFFYWYLTPSTRAFAERFIAKMDKPPTEKHAASYASANHWLKAVKAANTLDATTVAAKMRELPVEDFYNAGLKIYDNGCVPCPTHLLEVKPKSASKERFDLYNLLGTLASAEANPPPDLFGCPLVRK